MIRDLVEYIPGPDMGTNEVCMAWIKDEIGRVVGLPRVVGGIPLDEIGATGLGLAVAAEVAAPEAGIALQGARVAVEGFGAVGQHAARFLQAAGRGWLPRATAVAPCTTRPPDVDARYAHKQAGWPVATFAGGQALERDWLLTVDCDILVPAARPDVNLGRKRARNPGKAGAAGGQYSGH